MADKKITQLTNITGANLADADEFVVVDITADETKAITFSELKTAFDTGTGFVRVTGDTMTGNLSFGDNDKAIFGASSDLQIYHDGSNSYIKDVDTGNLYLEASAILVRKAGTSENIAKFVQDDRVELYYDNASKLTTTSTGIDVTGTVTSDGLTVETSSGAIATLSNSSTSTDSNTVIGKLVFENNDDSSAATNAEIMAKSDGTAGRTDVYIRGGSGSLSDRFKVGFNGDISFYEDTGTTAKFFWDSSAESLGIGTSSPSAPLHIEKASGNVGIQITSGNSSDTYINFGDSADTNAGLISYEHDNNAFAFRTAGTERMRIDSSGNVGLGTSSPLAKLQVKTQTNGNAAFQNSTSVTGGVKINAFNDAGNASVPFEIDGSSLQFNIASVEKMRIDSSGNVGIGDNTFAAGKLRVYDTAGNHIWLKGRVSDGNASVSFRNNADNAYNGRISTDNTSMNFQVNGSERMRIDSSGNLLVGKTTPALATAGTAIRGDNAGLINSARAGTVLELNRLTSDGSIVDFYKDGSTVGSIGAKAGHVTIGHDDVGVRFHSVNNLIYPHNMTTGATPNGTISFGSSGSRFKDVWASGSLVGDNAYLSGGVYLGGTGSANKLDDYEEGTWTPAFLNFNGTSGWGFSNAKYTKIGNLVYLSCDISGGSGTLISTQNASRLTGMPFVVSGTYSPCSFATNYITDEGTGVLYGNVVYSPTFSITNEKVIYFSGVYQTAT